MRVARAETAVHSPGRFAMLTAAAGAVLVALALLVPRTRDAADAGAERRSESRLAPGSVPHLAPDVVTLVPGVHLLGRTHPNAAYLVETSAGLVLVDTCKETGAGPILEQLRTLELEVSGLKAILLTHAHGDHSLGARKLRELTGARVHAGRGDAGVLRDGGPREAFFSIFEMPGEPHATEIDVPLDDGQEIVMGDARFRALATPGHTPGSVCYLLEKDGLRILFAGDTIMSLSHSSPLTGPGTYAAALAPRYRGNLEDFEKTLRRLRVLPLPDLVLPGHPRADEQPESPQVSAWWWERLLAKGLDDLNTARERFERDGADFLDGTPRELLPGLHSFGEVGGAALYAIVAPSGEITLVNAPGGAGLPEFVKRRVAEAGLGAATPAAVLLTSCAPAATGGLRALVEATRCRVYAPEEGIAAIAAACPPGTEVLPAAELARRGGFEASVIPIQGAASPTAAIRLRWASKTVLFTGEIPEPVAFEPDGPERRWRGPPPLQPAEVARSLPDLQSAAPDLWLPLHTGSGQNANLYGDDWPRTIRHSLECLSQPGE